MASDKPRWTEPRTTGRGRRASKGNARRGAWHGCGHYGQRGSGWRPASSGCRAAWPALLRPAHTQRPCASLTRQAARAHPHRRGGVTRCTDASVLTVVPGCAGSLRRAQATTSAQPRSARSAAFRPGSTGTAARRCGPRAAGTCAPTPWPAGRAWASSGRSAPHRTPYL